MKFNLDVKIVPKDHYIKVSGILKNIDYENGANIFYLNKDFNLYKLSSNGKAVNYKHDKENDTFPNDNFIRPVVLDTPVSDLEFEYDGYIPEPIWNVNIISESFVELAIYSGWFSKNFLYVENTHDFIPEYINNDFEFELKVELP